MLATLSSSSAQFQAGKRWVAGSRFANRTAAEAFKTLETQLRASVAKGQRPVVVFDLDQTLYSNRVREQQALDRVVKSAPLPQGAREKLSHVKVREAWYGIDDAASFAGLSLDSKQLGPVAADIRKVYRAGLDEAERENIDPPYAGAVDYVKKLHALGATVVYLSARLEQGSGPATRAMLKRDGFPIGDARAQLLMKADASVSDAEFKRRALSSVGAKGTVVGTFDNEPSNVVNLQAAFPNAVNVFVDTAASRTPAALVSGVFRIQGWPQR